MRTKADLLAALYALEQRAPEPGPVLRAIRSVTGPPRSGRPARARRRTLSLAATAVVCAGTAVALVLTLLPGGEISHRRATGAGHTDVPSRTQPMHPSARPGLLLAAAHVSPA